MEPESGTDPLFRVVQLVPGSSDDPRDTGDGGGTNHGTAVIAYSYPFQIAIA